MPKLRIQAQRKERHGRRAGRHAPALGAAGPARRDRAEVRMRRRRMPRVHLPCERQAVQVCTLTAADVVGKKVTTIEGLAGEGGLHPVQQAWLDEDVAQCGFCQPGQIMQAAALLKSNRNPSDTDIDQIMNVCRCGTYCRIRKAIKRAASTM